MMSNQPKLPKRTNTSPTVPASKRQNQPSIEKQTDQDEQQQPSTFQNLRAIFSGSKATEHLARSVSTMSLTTNASNVSSSSHYDPADSFGGTKTGSERDLLEIDIISLDDKQVKTNLTEADIYNLVIRSTLGIRRGQINQMYMGWQGHQYIQVKLKEKMMISDIAGTYECVKPGMGSNGEKIDHIIKFEVRGNVDRAQKPRDGAEEEDQWIRWVKVEHTGLEVDKPRVEKLLKIFGTPLSELREVTIKLVDNVIDTDDDQEEEVVIGTGKLEMRMIITTHIPQYIPAFGRKIKIHYKGIEHQCTNCFLGGHYRADCTSERLDWLDYVLWFKENFPEVDSSMLGRWNVLAGIHKVKKSREAEQASQASASTSGKINPDKIPDHISQQENLGTLSREVDPENKTRRTRKPKSQPTGGASAPTTRSKK